MTISSRKPGPTRVALVGYGLAGAAFHAPLIAATPDMVLGGLVTRDLERVAKARIRFPEAKIFSSTDDLFVNVQDFDLVVIASPNKTHYQLAKQALQAGLAVVVDKPMAATHVECLELIRLANHVGRPLSVFQNRRWDSDFLTVKKLVAEKRLGAITRFESRFERWRPAIRPGHWREAGTPDDAGGLLYDLGSHLIDQSLHLFGTPQSVYGELDIRREGGRVEDDVFVALSFAGGVHAHLWASAIACSGGPRFQIFGTKGTFRKYGLDPQEDALRSGMIPSDPNFGVEPATSWGQLFTDDAGAVTEKRLPSEAGRYVDFYQQINRAITDGAAVPVDPAEAAQVIRVIEQIQRCDAVGRIGPIP